MKCCKIICSYFGGRRNIHNTPPDMVEFIKSRILNEKLQNRLRGN